MFDGVGLGICERRGAEEGCFVGSGSTVISNFTRRGGLLFIGLVVVFAILDGGGPSFGLGGRLIDDSRVARLFMVGMGSALLVWASLERAAERVTRSDGTNGNLVR